MLEIYKVIQWKIYESEDLNLTDVEKQIYNIKLTGILISLKKVKEIEIKLDKSLGDLESQLYIDSFEKQQKSAKTTINVITERYVYYEEV